MTIEQGIAALESEGDKPVSDPNAEPGSKLEVVPEITPKVEETPDKTIEAKPSQQEVYDWMKDARYGKMWKDPNDVYKSYRQLEKFKAEQHDPLKKQFDFVVKSLKEDGYSVEQIKDILKENKQWKDPENLTVHNGTYVNKWLDNPMYKEDVMGFFKELDTRELQRMYPNMTQEQIEKFEAQKKEVDDLKAWKEEESHRVMVSDYRHGIDESMKKIKELSQSRGFEFNENEFYDHCMKNSIDPKYMLHEFRNLHDEAMEKTYRERIQSETLDNVKKNKGASIIDGGTGIQQAPPSGDNPDGILRNAVKSWFSKNQ